MGFIAKRIRHRINRLNKNWMSIICGETGSGKSYAALRLAEEIDPTFSIKRVVFNHREFMKLLNSGKLRRGNCIIFDEAGVGLPAREWYSISNKAINYVLQTFRRENLAVIFTTPSLDFIDKQTRKLLHAYLECVAIDFKKKQCVLKYYQVQANPRYDKIYYKYPRKRLKDGRAVIVDKIMINLPSQELIEQYEEEKKKFTRRLGRGVVKDIDRAEIKKKRAIMTMPKDIGEIVEDVKRNITLYVKEFKSSGRKGVDYYKIMANYKIGEPTAKKVRSLIEEWLKK